MGELGEADAGAERHGVPAGWVVEEYFAYGGKIFFVVGVVIVVGVVNDTR